MMPKWMRRTFAQLVPIVCTDEAVELGLVDETVEQCELFVQSIPGFLRLMLIVGTWVFEYGAIVLPSSRLRNFSRMTREKQEKYFHRYWHARSQLFRQLAKGIKVPIAQAYWENPVVCERLGYRPKEFIAEVTARRQRDYAEDIVAHDQLVLAPDPLVPAADLSKKVKHAKAS